MTKSEHSTTTTGEIRRPLKALCVVAGNLAERAWAVMNRAMPYVVTDGTPVNPEQAEQIIAEQWTVPSQVRARRRSTKARAGKAPQQVLTGQGRSDAQGATNEAAFPANDPLPTGKAQSSQAP